MKYPEDFTTEARRLFPLNTHLHTMIKNGGYEVGLWLHGHYRTHIAFETILEIGSLAELQDLVHYYRSVNDLYIRWRQLADSADWEDTT